MYKHDDHTDEIHAKRVDSKRDPRKRAVKDERKQARRAKYAAQGR